MHRFFLSPNQIKQEDVAFPEDVSHQIARVLRLEVGRKVQVLDGSGWEYTVELTDVDPHLAAGRVIEKAMSSNEPVTKVHMFLALTQRERFEWMLQKCTEIGVASFTPLITTRSLIQHSVGVVGKYPRWQKIIQEAAEQSHRGKVPQLNSIISYPELMKTVIDSKTSGLFFWEEENRNNLKDVLKSITGQQVNLVIGPEGGFTKEEADAAVKAGYKSVSLGKRIMRVETAAIIAAGLVLYELG
jgi:16S rRNA (uracil1498-N3)-methyltransferase